MRLQLELVGGAMVAIALLHIGFPRLFRWREQLAGLSLINRQLMQVHTFFIALTVLLMGLLCLSSAGELVATPLGRRVSLGLALFWAARLAIQLFGYSSRLWRGRRLETALHLGATALWIWFSAVFLAVGLGGG